MFVSRHRLHIPLVALAFAALGFVNAASAGTVKLPKSGSYFSVDLPDGWTYEFDKDGDITCEPDDKSGYSLQIISVPDVTTKAEMKTTLPEVAKAIASKGKTLSDLEIGDIEDSTNGHKIPFTGLRADGKHDGVAIVLILHAFEPKKGKWFVLLTVGGEKADKAHNDDYDAIFDSINTLK